MIGSPVASLDQVCYRYRKAARLAVDHVSLAFDARPTVLVGTNGAGKSTLLHLAVGRLQPTEGVSRPNGRAGFAGQFTPVLPGFTVRRQVEYTAWLAGLSKKRAVDLAGEALELARMSDLASRQCSSLSGGERARLGIAGALAVGNGLVVLDEPTASLDPLARVAVAQVLSDITQSGSALLITSHTAQEIGPPFQRVVMLNAGSIVFDGPPQEFMSPSHSDPTVEAFAAAVHLGR